MSILREILLWIVAAEHSYTDAHRREAVPLRPVREVIPIEWSVTKASSNAYGRATVLLFFGKNGTFLLGVTTGSQKFPKWLPPRI